jgi:hypothetical protein
LDTAQILRKLQALTPFPRFNDSPFTKACAPQAKPVMRDWGKHVCNRAGDWLRRYLGRFLDESQPLKHHFEINGRQGEMTLPKLLDKCDFFAIL